MDKLDQILQELVELRRENAALKAELEPLLAVAKAYLPKLKVASKLSNLWGSNGDH